MGIAIDPRGERGFITPEDLKLPEDQQTEWLVSDLNERQRVAFMDSVRLMDDGAGGTALGGTGTRIYTALKGGLKGFSDSKPFLDAAGKVVKFIKNANGQVSDEFLARMTWADKVAIADDITKTLALSEDDTEK